MGRHYSGNIAGKFWFGVQSSADAENFGGKITKNPRYLCCDCIADTNNSYCDGCYESFEEHFDDAVGDEFLEQSQKDEPNILLEYPCEFDTEFDGDQLEEVQGHIAELDKTALKFIKSFTMDADSDYEYDYEIKDEYAGADCEFNDKVSEPEKELLARWCLAKQVEQCLKSNGTCSFTCDE